MNDRNLILKKSKIVIGIILLISHYSCVDILICSSNKYPKLPKKDFNNAVLNSSYSERIDFDSNNSGSYFYEIKSVEGLPKGIHCSYYSGEFIVIEGTPTERGNFNFSVCVEITEVIGEGDDSTTCYDTSCQSYTLIVE